MAEDFSKDKVVQQFFEKIKTGRSKDISSAIKKFVEDEDTDARKINNVLKELKKLRVKNFGKIQKTLKEEAELLESDWKRSSDDLITFRGQLGRAAKQSGVGRFIKKTADIGRIWKSGTIGERLSHVTGLGDREDLADQVRERRKAKQIEKIKQRKKEEYLKTDIGKYKSLQEGQKQGLAAGMPEEELAEKFEKPMAELKKTIEERNEEIRNILKTLGEGIADATREMAKATGKGKEKFEKNQKQMMEDYKNFDEELDEREKLFDIEEDDFEDIEKERKKRHTKRKNRPASSAARAAETMGMSGLDRDVDSSDYDLDENAAVEVSAPTETTKSAKFNKTKDDEESRRFEEALLRQQTEWAKSVRAWQAKGGENWTGNAGRAAKTVSGPGNDLADVKVTTLQNAILFNKKPLGISNVDMSGKLTKDKAALAIQSQIEYEKKKVKLDARKHSKERTDDQRFWEQQLDEVKEDEGEGGGGLLEVLAAILAFLTTKFLHVFKWLGKGILLLLKPLKYVGKILFDLTKGLGKLLTKLPIVGKYFAKAGDFLMGKRGLRDPKTGRFTKRENVAQRVGKRFKGTKLGKLMKIGKGAGAEAGEAGEVGTVAEGAEGAVAGGAEVAGTAAVGGEAAGGAAALASNPIGWIVAAVLGAAVAAFLVWKYIIPKKWKTKIEGVLTSVGHAAVGVWHGMEKVGKVIGHKLAGIGHIFKRVAVDIVGAASILWKVTKPIRDFFARILIAEIRGAWKVIQVVGKWFGKGIKAFKVGLKAIEGVLMPIFNFIGHAADVVKHALGKAWDWLEDHIPLLKTATKAVKTVAHEVKQTTVAAYHKVISTAKSTEKEFHTAGESALGETTPATRQAATKATQATRQAATTKAEHTIAGQSIIYRHAANDKALADKLIKSGAPISKTAAFKRAYANLIQSTRKDVSKPVATVTSPRQETTGRAPAIGRATGSAENVGTMQVAATSYKPVIHVHTPETKPAPVTRNMPTPNLNIPTLDNTSAMIDDSGLLFLNLSAY